MSAWITVRFGPDASTRVPVAALAAAAGIAPTDVDKAITELIDAGWLTPAARGVYDATLPAGYEA